MSNGDIPEQTIQAQNRIDRLRDLCNLAHLIVDFIAGVTFVIGSWLFFYPDWETTGIWFFLVGSVAFALKPTIRLYHKIQHRRTRRQLEEELSDEALAHLHRLRPARAVRSFL